MRHLGSCFTAGLVLAATVTSCRQPATVTSLGLAPSVLGAEAVAPAAAPSGTSEVRFAVRWPSRSVQFIPASAERMEFAIFLGDETRPAATRTVLRAAGPTALTTMTHLPAGPARVTATAKDGAGVIVATASAPLTLLANQVVQARLSLQPTEPLGIARLFPTNGIPGPWCQLNVEGTGLMLESAASYSIAVGDVPIPADRIFRIRETPPYMFAFNVPREVLGGPVTLRMGPYAVTSSESFTVISSVSLSPLAVALAPGATTTFEVKAYDAEGNLVESPSLRWYMENETCIGNICEDHDAAKVNNGLVTAERDVGYFNPVTQTYQAATGPVAKGDLVVGNPYVRATASITVIIP